MSDDSNSPELSQNAKRSTLSEDESRYFDSLNELRRAAWESTDHRRPFEWKVCLAVWTALALFVGSVVTARLAIASWSVVCATILAGLAIVFLHYRFIKGLRNAHNIDKETEGFFRTRMCEFLEIELPQTIQRKVKRVVEERDLKKVVPFIAHWNSGFQVGITILLAICCVVAVLANRKPRQADEAESVWEYKVLSIRQDSIAAEFEQQLNSASKEGWQILSVSEARSDITNAQDRVIMQRRRTLNE